MPNFAPRWTLLALVLISLSACGTASSNAACVCLPIKEYSKQKQNKLANEINAAPRDAVFPDVVQDYAVLRTQLNTCQR